MRGASGGVDRETPRRTRNRRGPDGLAPNVAAMARITVLAIAALAVLGGVGAASADASVSVKRGVA
jgi:hypothetical protein